MPLSYILSLRGSKGGKEPSLTWSRRWRKQGHRLTSVECVCLPVPVKVMTASYIDVHDV